MMGAANNPLEMQAAWKRETEILITHLKDRLDILKQYGCLTISLDVSHLLPRKSVQYMRCMTLGSQILEDRVRQRFEVHLGKPLSEFQTPTLIAMTESCCLDDVNFDHVFKSLRTTELLENCSSRLSVKDQAHLVCAMIGELVLVSDALAKGHVEGNNESTVKCSMLLRATASQIIDFICESGRDRAASMKSSVPIGVSGPRPRSYDASSTPAFHFDPGLSDLILGTPASMYSLQGDSDAMLEELLLQGSLLSILHRLQSLWITIDPTRQSRRQRYERGSNDTGAISTVARAIRLSVFRAVPQMMRLRRLMFTRFLHTLFSPIFIAPPSHLAGDCAPRTTYMPPQLVQLVVAGFLDTGKTHWPYESKEQLETIDQCPLLPEEMKRKLRSIICIPDSMTFCTRSDEFRLRTTDAGTLFQCEGDQAGRYLNPANRLPNYLRQRNELAKRRIEQLV